VRTGTRRAAAAHAPGQRAEDHAGNDRQQFLEDGGADAGLPGGGLRHAAAHVCGAESVGQDAVAVGDDILEAARLGIVQIALVSALLERVEELVETLGRLGIAAQPGGNRRSQRGDRRLRLVRVQAELRAQVLDRMTVLASGNQVDKVHHGTSHCDPAAIQAPRCAPVKMRRTICRLLRLTE
jgi:hypothetical protein